MNTTTATTTTTTGTDANESLVRIATDKLMRSAARNSLDELVAARTRRSLLLVDCSSSMAMTISTGARRIDALRQVVETLRESHPVPVAAFSGGGVRLVDTIPNPSGGTPMAEAIDYAKAQGANHAVLVTDGEAGEWQVLESARNFGGPIDTFFIGDKNDRGSELARRVAEVTGGVFNVADLGKPKELGAKLRGLIGDGSL